MFILVRNRLKNILKSPLQCPQMSRRSYRKGPQMSWRSCRKGPQRSWRSYWKGPQMSRRSYWEGLHIARGFAADRPQGEWTTTAWESHEEMLLVIIMIWFTSLFPLEIPRGCCSYLTICWRISIHILYTKQPKVFLGKWTKLNN